MSKALAAWTLSHALLDETNRNDALAAGVHDALPVFWGSENVVLAARTLEVATRLLDGPVDSGLKKTSVCYCLFCFNLNVYTAKRTIELGVLPHLCRPIVALRTGGEMTPLVLLGARGLLAAVRCGLGYVGIQFNVVV